MATISQPLLGAGAEAKNDWASAKAATSLSFTGEAVFRRGIEVAIGLNALATADAGLSKFVDATVRGNAFAEAKATLRLGFPLNLFKRFGLTIGAQAVAQAAAGIEVGLGLAIGDFIALLRRNPESSGLPIDLVVLLLEESVVGGTVEVHVAAAAMAYASIEIAGEVVVHPGFRVLAEAGLGLAAGVGFSGHLDIGIKDFRKFYGRAVDRSVAAILDGIVPLLPDDHRSLKPVAEALAPIAAMSLRLAYEVGDYVAKQAPAANRQEALNLSNHCVGIVLEEAQRFLFGRFLEAGLKSLEHLIINGVSHLSPAEWDGLFAQRQALANSLMQVPADPFQPTPENAVFWSRLIARATDLVGHFPTAVSADVVRGMSMVFAATELLTRAIETRINTAQAYAFAIGAGTASTRPPSFLGSLGAQPGKPIRDHINGTIGKALSHQIDYADLIAYLIDAGVVSALRSAIPGVDAYLSIFQPAIADDLGDILAVLLQSRDAFHANAAGQPDPQATLALLLGALDAFVDVKIQQDLVPVVNGQLSDDTVRLYFNEVLLSTLLYTKREVFRTILAWEDHPVDRDAFTEALAGVMMMLLGRSLVLVGEGMMAAMQAQMAEGCRHAANQIESRRDPFAAMRIAPSPELKALFAETLRIGGEVFGPLPDDTRRRLRFALYDVMETLPPDAAARADFVANLKDQFFVPNRQSVDELTDELFAISRDRFQLFVNRVLESGARLVLAALEDFIKGLIDTVLAWADQLGKAIRRLFDQIEQLEREIERLIGQAEQAFDAATARCEALLDQFAKPALRNRLRGNIADEIYRRAKGVLADNRLYQGLPGDARRAVRGVLKTVIDDAIEGPLLDPLLDAMGAVASDLETVVDDVRDLNPDDPLAPQLLDLIVDRIEDRIRDAFGGSKPRIHLGIDVQLFGLSYHFGLGTIELPFGTLFSILRDAIAALDYYENALQAAAAALGDAFQRALDLAGVEAARDTAKAEHDRLDRIRREFTSQPKSITIVNPVQSLVYDDDLEVRINLGGVPPSYLGLYKGEQQRVLIFLNAQIIPPQSLALDDPFAAVDAPPLRNPLAPRPRVTAGTADVIAAGRSAQITFQPRQAAASSVTLDRTPAVRAPFRSLAAGKVVASSRPTVQQRAGAARDGRLISTTAVVNVLPGRRMAASKRNELEQSLPAGTNLRFLATREHLAAGTNTLVVVVIDPGGQRYQHAVSFAVTADGKPPIAGLPSLPAIPGRKKNGKPTRSPDRIDLHLSQASLASRVSKAHDFLGKRSAAVFDDLDKLGR